MVGVRRMAPWLVLGGFVLALALLPRLTGFTTAEAPDVTDPHAFSERPPFGTALPGALAYLSDDRIFTLVDLSTGHVIGSKGIPTERRPAAASATRAFLGSVPAGRMDGNWDRIRSLPWDATQYRDDARGVSVAYSDPLDMLGAAMQPLPGGGNGVVLAGSEGSQVVAESDGQWRFAVWVGDRLLVRELSGSDVRWWLFAPDGTSTHPPLPADLLPVAGGDGVVFGMIGGSGAIVDVVTGETVPVAGDSSWAAAWQPGGDLLVTLASGPAALHAYDRGGELVWVVPLAEPVTRFRGGVAWGPDGSFLVVSAGRTIVAFDESGTEIGDLARSAPNPQSAPGAAFVTVVATG